MWMAKALLGNDSVSMVNVQQWKICLSGRMLLLVTGQKHSNEDAA
jgi:hypothetical protein